MNAKELHDLGYALSALSAARMNHGLDLTLYGGIDVAIVGSGMNFVLRWDEDNDQYVVEEQR